ncbi:transport between ER and Golgi ATPase protein [Puccinia graminis f. sp. tritici]|uniref:Transport between ER and Golgi ATPase protein n=1 Tax=Puccinia graminis f. sp. tritici TaxID=56615 RepID=A0A5B0QBM9_PUCGR|nr:transport between ER and Golgi ATPase protein [Puccinia graminis f. sp. tritici]
MCMKLWLSDIRAKYYHCAEGLSLKTKITPSHPQKVARGWKRAAAAAESAGPPYFVPCATLRSGFELTRSIRAAGADFDSGQYQQQPATSSTISRLPISSAVFDRICDASTTGLVGLLRLSSICQTEHGDWLGSAHTELVKILKEGPCNLFFIALRAVIDQAFYPTRSPQEVCERVQAFQIAYKVRPTSFVSLSTTLFKTPTHSHLLKWNRYFYRCPLQRSISREVSKKIDFRLTK